MKVRYNPNNVVEARFLMDLIEKNESTTIRDACTILKISCQALISFIFRTNCRQVISVRGFDDADEDEIIMKKDNDLTINKIYEVLYLDENNYRILSDGRHSGVPEPFCYSQEIFDIVDNNVPEGWVVTRQMKIELHPPELPSKVFCNLFEYDPESVEKFDSALRLRFPESYSRWSASNSKERFLNKIKRRKLERTQQNADSRRSTE